MPYEHKKRRREEALKNYYKNRDEKILYQREYDKSHKEQKNKYEREKRRGNKYNLIKLIQHYSQKHHLPILLKSCKHCELCPSKIKLQIHHKKYTKKIKDCMLVCENCHKKISRKV